MAEITGQQELGKLSTWFISFCRPLKKNESVLPFQRWSCLYLQDLDTHVHAFTRTELEILSPPLCTPRQWTDTNQILSISLGTDVLHRGKDLLIRDSLPVGDGPVEGLREGE